MHTVAPCKQSKAVCVISGVGVIEQFKAMELRHKREIEEVTGVSDYMLGCCESELSVRPVGVERKEPTPHTHTPDNIGKNNEN